jgi:hypothetical protein
MIMVFNIADYSFWDPTYPFYGQGYFAPSLIPFYDRNIVHISSYNWKEFLGPANQELPHQTEAILAHEFAHLLGFEQNPFQAAYLTEGISEFSQVYCGYRIHPVLINAYLVQPDNSLISGDDYGMMNMADYGAMALFVTYIADHFGSDVVHEIVASGSLGKDAVTRGLMVAGHPSWNFDRVFEKWRLANLIHSHSPGNGWYDYSSLDLSDPVYAAIKSNEYNATNDGWVASAADRFGNSIDVDGWDTGISMLGPYGTDYVHIQGEDLSWLNRPNGVKKFLFDGEDKQVGWQRQATGVLPSTWTLSSEGDVASPWAVVTKDLAKRDFCIAAGPIGKEQGQVAIEVIGDSVGFDTRNRSGLNLSFSFRSYPSYNAPSSVEVLLSTDQGNEYTSVYVVDYWSFFYWTSVTVDIGWATGYEDVRLALRFIDPSYGGDMAMFFFDDIVVQDDKGTTLYSEDFDHFVIDHWWSDYSDLLDTSLICSVDLTRQESATLSIDTWYHIESPYDAGFVQVSVDRGETWTSLSNEYSFSDVGDDILPMILENGPRLNKYFGGPNDWITMDFDLGAYVGEKVMIRFWHVTDSFTPMPDPDMGWNIKDVRINGVSLEPSSFVTAPTHPRNDWMVTVYFPAFMTKNGKEFPAKVVSLNPSERSERTSMLLAQYSMYKEAYIVVSATVGPSDYGFGIGSAFPT